MNTFMQYMFDVVTSLTCPDVPEKLEKSFHRIISESLGGDITRRILKNYYDEDNTVLAYIQSNDSGLKFKYFTDDFECSDMEFTITEDNIDLTVGKDLHTSISKTDYFNITVGYNGNSIIDFDKILELQKHVEKFEGITILYAPNEEIQYGYV